MLWRCTFRSAAFSALVLAAAAPAAANPHDQARYAATYPGLEMKRELEAVLNSGFDINTRYSSPAGWTLLHFAASEGYVENVRFLLDRGADPSLADARGRTALDLTRSEGVRTLLVQHSASRAASGSAAAPAAAPRPSATVTAPARSNPSASTAPQAPPAAAATAGGGSAWDRFGRFSVGDAVLFAQEGGKRWDRGTVVRVGGAPGVVKDKYLVRTASGYEDWWDADQVTSVQPQPYWTGFFVGDWRLGVPMSRVTRVEGGDVYRVYSGGVRLPPLRVNADGTYVWVTTKYGGGEEVVRGRWEPNPRGPGLVLKQGERGDDWLLYTVNTAQGRETYGTDHVYLSSDNHPAKQGFRIR